MATFTLAQAKTELAKITEAVAARQAVASKDLTDTEVVRAFCFTMTRVALGRDYSGKPLSAGFLSKARALHFKMYGTPEIDPAKWLRNMKPYVCIDVGNPNAVAVPDADGAAWGY